MAEKKSTYEVTIMVETEYIVTVSASSEDEAEDKALRTYESPEAEVQSEIVSESVENTACYNEDEEEG